MAQTNYQTPHAQDDLPELVLEKGRIETFGRVVDQDLSDAFALLSELRRSFASDLRLASAGFTGHVTSLLHSASSSSDPTQASHGPTSAGVDGPVLDPLLASEVQKDLQKLQKLSSAYLSKISAVFQVRDETSQRLEHILNGIDLLRAETHGGKHLAQNILVSLTLGVCDLLAEKSDDAIKSIRLLGEIVAKVMHQLDELDAQAMSLTGGAHGQDEPSMSRGAVFPLPSAVPVDVEELRSNISKIKEILVSQTALLEGQAALFEKLEVTSGKLNTVEAIHTHLDAHQIAIEEKESDIPKVIWASYTMDSERDIHFSQTKR